MQIIQLQTITLTKYPVTNIRYYYTFLYCKILHNIVSTVYSITTELPTNFPVAQMEKYNASSLRPERFKLPAQSINLQPNKSHIKFT